LSNNKAKNVVVADVSGFIPFFRNDASKEIIFILFRSCEMIQPFFSDTLACPWHSSMSYWNCYDLTSSCRIPDGVPTLTLDNNLPLPLGTVS